MISKIVSLLIVALFISCSNVEPNIDPNPLYGNDGRYGNFVQDTIYAKADSVFRGKYLNTSASTKLSLGEYDGMIAGFEISFVSFPADSIEVDSVYLKMSTLNSFGPNSGDVINSTMYKIQKSWVTDDDDLTDSINVAEAWRNPTDGSFAAEIGPVDFFLEDSMETSILLPLETFNDWRINEDLNFGLYFHPTQEDIVVELGARTSSLNPMLVYYTHIDDSVIMDTIYVSSDASIYNYNENGSALNFDENMLIVSSGTISKMLLKFDLSGLPEKAIFYSTDIVLTEDDLNPYENPENATSLYLKPLEKLSTNQDDFVFSPNLTFSLSSDEGFSRVLGIYKNSLSTDVVQEIINGTVINDWFQIEFASNNDEISVKRFWGAKADKSLAPKLIVKYLNEK